VAVDGLFLGLISGTSADGIDAALAEFHGDRAPHPIAARTFAYPGDLRAAILRHSQQDEPLALDALGALDHRIGAAFADAAAILLRDAGVSADAVRAIGSHGQTLRHRPQGDAPFTLQLGDPNLIAERTGICVVADFRRRDVAAGGQGAPLLPGLHAAVLASPDEDRAVLNLGGIANLTLLPRAGKVRGFDTGPANGLLDAWCLRHRGESFDRSGGFAASGTCHPDLLDRLLAEPWLALPPPKSTGRDLFHLEWLSSRLDGLVLEPADVQATLLEYSARTIAHALNATQPATQRVIACGGGVHNPVLLARIAAHLPGITVESSAVHGLDPDFVEALGFAWLAQRTLSGQPGNLPSVSGARGPRVLGAIYPA
jgi:anhydro-N-acetylmuramic acid kinase